MQDSPMPRSILIALISYGAQPLFQVQDTISALMFELGRRGIEVEKKTRAGDGMVPRARNAFVSDFLGTSATDLLMIDDDNWCDVEGLLRILDAPADVVGAPIRLKQEPTKWNIGFLPWAPLEADENGLLEVEHVGTGIMRIRRPALERMVEAAADEWYHDNTAASGRSHWLFGYSIVDHKLRGEDVSLCHRWRALGGEVFVIPDIKTHHVGKHDYRGDLAGWLAMQAPRIEIVDAGGHSETVPNRFADPLPAGPAACKVVVCVASRGRPTLVWDTVQITLAASTRPDTMVSVALDRDDETIDIPHWAADDLRVRLSILPREDSLGEKYNRCALKCPGDLYVIATDDAAIATPGWDDRLAAAAASLPGGIGVVYFGKMTIESALPAMYAVTARFAELVGYLQPTHFPTWWHDTWTDEIARMTGTIVRADVEAFYPDKHEAARSRGVRDVLFWARFFEETRRLRVAAARTILMDPALRGRRLEPVPSYNTLLLDPERARQVEASAGFDAPDDVRYQRIKAAAQNHYCRLDLSA